MDHYALYTYRFVKKMNKQGVLTELEEQDLKLYPTSDENIWLDRLFGNKKTDVRVQAMKRGKGADKKPCTVLAHENRVVFLRLENERTVSIYQKDRNNPTDIASINRINMPTNPYSFIFIDCREGKNLITIKKDSDAWRSTDTIANLLKNSINQMIEKTSSEFEIVIEPVTMPKDYWEYNKTLIKKDKRVIKKMTIYFTAGSIDPRVESIISKTPYLKRLMKELWSSSHGYVTYYDPLGPLVVDGRKRDIKNIIEIITSNAADTGFGLSLTYNDGLEVICGKDIRLEYKMDTDTFNMLFVKDLFGECRVNEWLDKASKYINEQKNETITESKRKRKASKQVSRTSAALDLL